MRPQAHIAGGILAAGIVTTVIQPSQPITDRLLLLGAVAGSLPDWDFFIYAARRRRFVFDAGFRHHTWITHTFPFYLLPALTFYLIGRYLAWPELQWAVSVFGLSVSVHLLQDMYGSADGIMLFYPFSRRMFGFELTGIHGVAWLEQYMRSRAYRVEQLSVVTALLFVVYYVFTR